MSDTDENPGGPPERDPDPRRLVLIVVGAHPRAEVADRPVAYRLQERMAQWIAEAERERRPLSPLVCTDVWYLNDDQLRRRPTVSIGPPETNALTAMLAGRLPSALAVDDVLMVQLHPDLREAVACCWGVDGEGTGAAVEAFCGRYLNAFMRAALAAD